MARGVNKVILIGHLGNDPEVRYLPNGGAVAQLSLATTDGWRDKQTGEQKEKTEWHRVVFYQRLAEVVKDYLKKGSKIYIEGKLQTRKWQNQQGQDQYMTEIIGNELQMLDSRGGPEQGFSGQNNQYVAPPPSAPPMQNQGGHMQGQAPQQSQQPMQQQPPMQSAGQPMQSPPAQGAPQQPIPPVAPQNNPYGQQPAPGYSTPPQRPMQQNQPPSEPQIDFDDDIPF